MLLQSTDWVHIFAICCSLVTIGLAFLYCYLLFLCLYTVYIFFQHQNIDFLQNARLHAVYIPHHLDDILDSRPQHLYRGTLPVHPHVVVNANCWIYH
jgi:hypothetical protein